MNRSSGHRDGTLQQTMGNRAALRMMKALLAEHQPIQRIILKEDSIARPARFKERKQ
jgi:hypothetical protein